VVADLVEDAVQEVQWARVAANRVDQDLRVLVRVLVVRRPFLETLLKDDPQAAYAVLFEVGRILAARAERLSSSCS